MPDEPRQCEQVKDDGHRCRLKGGSVSDETGLCLWHDPERKEEAMKARRRGGRNTRKARIRTVELDEVPPPPETLDDVVAWASWAIQSVATGRIDSRTGDTISKLCNTLERSIAKADLEKRVQELQAQLDAAKGSKVRAIR